MGGPFVFAMPDRSAACFSRDPCLLRREADGDPWDSKPNPDHIHFSVDDLEEALDRATKAGAAISRPIETMPWGERSFYCADPFGNKLCFVGSGTLFTGGLM
jgi:catechol 2,3-dioxygenase-like lactoylglutathione lyase family enzyme